MRIKRVYIQRFAGIKDKVLNFEKGFNLIYGENEAGKSSIENFIKIWLYGLEGDRSHKERKRYMPLTGENISGELILEYEGRGYIIKRVFGAAKKYDICDVFDEVTGEKVNLPYKTEPGQYFLKINYSTFNKTLFISQLGVKIDKDKEDEILEKITNIYNCGDESTSINKAMEKLEKRKRELIGLRKNGEIDSLIKEKELLKEELIEAYKLSEKNIDNEKEVLKNKELKKQINEKLKRLEDYKKQVKRLKLQDEYKDLNNYVLKRKKLKEQQDLINKELKSGDTLITSEFLDEIEDYAGRYKELLNGKNKRKDKISKLIEGLNEHKKVIADKYNIFSSMGNEAKQNIYELKVNQQMLEEKINNIMNIQNSLSRMKMDLANQSADVVSFEFIDKHRSKIEELLESYKEGLKELKYKIENQTNYKFERSLKDSDKKIKFVYIFGIMTVLIFFFSLVNKLPYVMIVCIVLSIILMKLYFTYSIAIKNNELVKKNNEVIQKLKDRVEDDEEELELYMKETDSGSYEEFITRITNYDKYKNHKEHMEYLMKEKEAEINAYDIADIKEVYNDNKKLILTFYETLSCNDMNEVLNEAGTYEKLNLKISKYEQDISSIEEEYDDINLQLKSIEDKLSERISKIDLEDINIRNILKKVRLYRKKITQKNEINMALKNVEDTYKVLLKNRNIDEITKKIEGFENKDIEYSSQSEDEIDEEIKKQSNLLLEVEKKIKDIEYSIEKIYFGKRDASDIEEEILVDSEKILKLRKEYDALSLASNTLNEAFDEIKYTIGPDINDSVIENFNELTGKNYKEVKMSEDYDLKIREDNVIINCEMLSNGAKDQLYLSLRIAFINMIFRDLNIPIFLDDAFTQYDDNRRKNALKLLINKNFEQIIFFSCQAIDKIILDQEKEKYSFISISNIDIFN